jgi:drug/metabolite transporter (DMT)-like permease
MTTRSTRGRDDDQAPPQRDASAIVFVVLMVLIGSTTATAAKFAVRELPTSLLPIARFGIAGLFLIPIGLRDGRLLRMLREDLPRVTAAAACCVPINQFFFLNGAKLAPTTHVGLIYATCPLMVLLLACLLGQEKMRSSRLAGILLSIVGAGVLAVGNIGAHGAGTGPRTLTGDLLLVGAVMSWAGYMTVNKPLVPKYGSLTVLAGTFLVGILLDLPIALAQSGSWSGVGTASRSAWLGLIYLGLVVTVFGLYFQNQALKRLDASQVAAVGNAAPLLTVVWGVWLLGEAVTPSLIVGGAMILGGVVWTSLPDRSGAKIGAKSKDRVVPSPSPSPSPTAIAAEVSS